MIRICMDCLMVLGHRCGVCCREYHIGADRCECGADLASDKRETHGLCFVHLEIRNQELGASA